MSDEFKVPAIDYTSRDVESIRDDAIARIPFHTEEWTDHTARDPGIVLLQLFAGMHDVMHYYADQKVREAWITTVRGKRAFNGIAGLVGGRLKGKAPSYVRLNLSIPVQVNPTPFPVGTLFTTVGVPTPVFFELAESVVIPTGQTAVNGVLAIAGQTVTQSVGVSTGLSFQEFRLAKNANVLDDGIVVSISNTPWNYVEALGQAGPDAQAWSYRRDEDGQVWVQFGNGTTRGGNGLIPPGGATISVTWREGGGRFTNVGAGFVKTCLSTILSGASPVAVSVNNPKPAQGGDEEETVKLARRRIPRAFRANDRGVIRQDFEALAEAVPGVLAAVARVTGVAQWTVWVLPHPTVGVGVGTDPYGYAVLSGKDQSDAALAELVRERLLGKCMETDGLIVKVARFLPVDIVTTVTLLPGAHRSKAEADIVRATAEFFDPTELRIGRTGRRDADIHVSAWDDALGAVKGVQYVDTTVFQLRPQIETIQAVGNPVFANISFARFTTEAFWEVYFIDALSYRVYRQDIDGGLKVPQSRNGVVGAGFRDDNGEVELLLTSPTGTIPPMSGDRFRFRASPTRSTVRVLEGEVAVQGNVSLTILGGA